MTVTSEQLTLLTSTVAVVGFVVNIVLTVWFVITLNRIQANTRRTAEDMAQLTAMAARAVPALPPLPPLPPPPPFRDDMTPAEVLAAIELRGGRLRTVDGYFTGRQAVIDNPTVLDELGRLLFRRYNATIAQLIVTRQVGGQ